MGIGEKYKGKEFAGCSFTHSRDNGSEDYLPLPSGNSNIILGIQWLEKSGSMRLIGRHKRCNTNVGTTLRH